MPVFYFINAALMVKIPIFSYLILYTENSAYKLTKTVLE